MFLKYYALLHWLHEQEKCFTAKESIKILSTTKSKKYNQEMTLLEALYK